MGIMARLSGWSGGLFKSVRKARDPGDDFWYTGLSESTATGIRVGQITALQASTCAACVSILSEDVAKLPVHVYRARSDGGKEIVKDHPVERLLQKPNIDQDRFEFIETMQLAHLLRGNAYAPILRDGRGRPTGLIPVNPDNVALWESPGGELFYKVTRIGYRERWLLRDFPDLIPADDVFHLRWMSQDRVAGLSRISLARESLGLSLAQEQHAARLAGNGARPGGVLQTDKKLTTEVLERLKSQWQDSYGGWARTGKTAVLEEGLKWQALTMNSVDMEFLASRRFQVEEIARIWRVPLHKLGVTPTGGTGPSAVQADQDYMNNVVCSYVERWEAKIDDVFGLRDEGLFVEFDVNRFLRADIQTRLNALRTGVIGMIYTPNEARRGEGLADIEGGDTLYQPTNVAPIGFMPSPGGAGPGSDVTGQPAPGGDGDPAAVPAIDE